PFRIVSGGAYSLASNQSQTVTIAYSPSGAPEDKGVAALSGGGGVSVSLSGQLLAEQPASFQLDIGGLTPPFIKNGSYISQTVVTGARDGGRIVYNFMVTNTGNYILSAVVNAPDETANSFYVNIDAEPTDPAMIWDIPITSGFESQLISWRGTGTAERN